VTRDYCLLPGPSETVVELVLLRQHRARDFRPDLSFGITASLECMSGLARASSTEKIKLYFSFGVSGLWFCWISFDYRVPLGFGSIASGLDHVNHVIRLPMEHEISRGTRVGTMAGVHINTLTMKQYLALSQENQALGMVKPEIRGNFNFKIKSQFMRELREYTFSGNKNEDAHDHVNRFLNTVSLFNILGVSQDAVLLHVFQFSLTRAAKRWVDRLTPGAVNTWDILKKAFIQRYCPPSKTTKRLEDIHSFKQESDESLYQAWERLAAIVSKLDNLGRDMKKLKENVHVIQVGCQICEGPHLNKEFPLNKEVKQVEEVKYDEFGTTNGAPSSSTRQCKVVNADHGTPHRPISLSKLNNLHEVSNFQGAQNEEERTTKVLQCQLPPKELNPGNFTHPSTIGNFNFYGMADLGASVNVMPRNIFEYLRLANLKNTNMLVEMVDMTKKAPLHFRTQRLGLWMDSSRLWIP
nr:hypothetical protein [Tanacetum cinerariifolium]